MGGYERVLGAGALAPCISKARISVSVHPPQKRRKAVVTAPRLVRSDVSVQPSLLDSKESSRKYP